MNRNNTWRTIAVVFITAWALYEMSPPTDRPLIDVFDQQAVNRDATFAGIVQTARDAAAGTNAGRAYPILREATGTNDLTRYFTYSTKGEKDPNRAILNRVQRDAAGKFRLGLDLRGGTSFLVGLDTNKVAEAVDKAALQEQAAEVLRRRVDKFGVAEPVIRPEGLDRISIQMPGLTEDEMRSAKEQIERPAFLEFRMVHPRSDELVAQGLMAPGHEVLSQTRRTPEGGQRTDRMLVKINPERGLTGKFIERAGVIRDPLSLQPKITFKFNTEGARLFGEITREHVNERMAIVLDGELYSAPNINEPILGGSGEISGDFNLKEAWELANVLENPLETPVRLLEVEQVQPSLGADSVRSGEQAALYGIIAVAAFMIGYYLLSGVISIVALAFNLILILGVMCSLGATFTLPGIAGIALTVGMAVDANVLIFERVREELAAGKSLRGALNAGYDKAWGTILDANLTTLIAAVILINMGTGPIKGFGVTLTIGICASVFSAIVITRLVFDFLLGRGLLTNLRMFHLVGGTKIDFLQFAKPAFALSWVLIFAGVGYGVFGRGANSLGVDFRGGDTITYQFAKKVTVAGLRDTIAQLQLNGKPMGDVTIQYKQNLGDGTEQLQITAPAGAGPQITQALKTQFADSAFDEIAVRQVGPTIGREILNTGLWSLIYALFGILAYVAFRYEFSFSVGAVVATIHDVLMTVGWFLLTGREINAPVIAAILAIIGYSVNDTIVIFDRIREDLKLGVRGTFKEVINKAINQTLSRSLITSGTTLLATLALFLFGGGVINDLAFTLLVGVLTGTYSSIYIASAIVLWWHKGQRPKLASQQIAAEHLVAEPAQV